MTDKAWEIQQALFSALDSALSMSVYDSVPDGTDYPYVTIDRISTSNADALTDKIDERFCYLTIWSTYAGQKEVLQTMTTIYDTFHRKSLSVSGATIQDMEVFRRDTSRDVDERTFMGHITIRFFVSL